MQASYGLRPGLSFRPRKAARLPVLAPNLTRVVKDPSNLRLNDKINNQVSGNIEFFEYIP